MLLWRISNHADLSGRGGMLYSGRWNWLGTSVVYCSDHPATALLETLAHVDRDEVPTHFRLLSIEVPDGVPTTRLEPADLPANWRSAIETTRAAGSDLLRRGDHLLIFVPCVLVPFTWNVLFNPGHASAKRCSISNVIEEAYDLRLLRPVPG